MLIRSVVSRHQYTLIIISRFNASVDVSVIPVLIHNNKSVKTVEQDFFIAVYLAESKRNHAIGIFFFKSIQFLGGYCSPDYLGGRGNARKETPWIGGSIV